MKRSCIIFLGLLCVLGFDSGHCDLTAAQPHIRLLSLQWPPYVGAGLKDKGYVASLVRAAYQASGDTRVEIDFMLWHEALKAVQSGRYDGIFPAYYSDERAKSLIFSDAMPGGPLVLYKKKSLALNYKDDLNQLKPYGIGVVKGYVNTQALDAAKGLNKIYAPTDIVNLSSLIEGKVDMIAIDNLAAQYLILMHYPDWADKLEALSPPLEIKPLYVAISRKVPQAGQKVKDFNVGLQIIKENGRFQEILKQRDLMVPATAGDLMLITEELPPLNFTENGHLTGLAVDIVEEIKRRLGDTDAIQIMPWARGYNMASKGMNVALFSTTRMPSREEQFQWVGPIASLKRVFYKRRDSKIKINSLEDARKVKRIATYYDDAADQMLMQHGFTNLDRYTTPESGLKKLLAGRVDLWATSNLAGQALMNQLGVDESRIVPAFVAQTRYLYIAFSRNTSPAIIAAWQTALDQLKNDGTFSKIYQTWLPGENPPGKDSIQSDAGTGE